MIKFKHSCFLLLLVAIAITSCNKDDQFSDFDITDHPETTLQQAPIPPIASALQGCGELEPIQLSNYPSFHHAMEDLFGPVNFSAPLTCNSNDGFLENYISSCGQATPYGGNCCSAVTVFLDGNGGSSHMYSPVPFEIWNPSDPVFSDGILSVQEQLDFIARIINAAQGLTFPCSNGFLVPSNYCLEFFPITNGSGDRSIFVKVTYTPVCLFSL